MRVRLPPRSPIKRRRSASYFCLFKITRVGEFDTVGGFGVGGFGEELNESFVFIADIAEEFGGFGVFVGIM